MLLALLRSEALDGAVVAREFFDQVLEALVEQRPLEPRKVGL